MLATARVYTVSASTSGASRSSKFSSQSVVQYSSRYVDFEACALPTCLVNERAPAQNACAWVVAAAGA
eukprot:3433741-Prymnesium_polylepis.2